jgi:hypothetical protein
VKERHLHATAACVISLLIMSIALLSVGWRQEDCGWYQVVAAFVDAAGNFFSTTVPDAAR